MDLEKKIELVTFFKSNLIESPFTVVTSLLTPELTGLT